MTSPAPTAQQPPIQTLDHLRHRLITLSTTLHTLTATLQSHNPLPPQAQLQETLTSTVREISQLASFVRQHKAVLDSTVVYPSPGFGWVERGREGVVAELGRKSGAKGSRRWEGWVGDALAEEEGARSRGTQGEGKEGEKLSREQRRELWGVAKEVAREELERIPRGLDFTVGELVNGVDEVVTGLSRRLNAGEEVIVDDGEEKVDDGVSMSVENVLRFMTRGEQPRSY